MIGSTEPLQVSLLLFADWYDKLLFVFEFFDVSEQNFLDVQSIEKLINPGECPAVASLDTADRPW